tara:strand:- start:1272 stop:1508 length:237 start_codon:yes stop_codon:yes gene_type:complete
MAAAKKKRRVAMVELKEKIIIDKNNYVKVFTDGNFEVHCTAHGPLGANVYMFENRGGGLLKWSQRRGCSFVTKLRYFK